MSLVITRVPEGEKNIRPRSLGHYRSVPAAARALASALKRYSEYGSDPKAQCWWAQDENGRRYRFDVHEAEEAVSRTRRAG
jgi:hypothetical protein